MAQHPYKFVEPLSEAERECLQNVWREHETYVVRCRAHAILLSSQGYTVEQLQKIFDISRPTALGWINRWQELRRDGLEDKPRSGAPPKLTDDEQDNIVRPLLEQLPRQPWKIIEAIRKQTGKIISRTTLRRIARKLGFRWKRFRRSQRKQRDEGEFRKAMEDIDDFRSSRNVDLAYFDEAGFSVQAVVPYGWQYIGERRELPVGEDRATVQVLGIQEENAQIYGYLHKGRVYGSTVAEVLDDYSQRINHPTVLILDNASVHTCNLIFDHMNTWNDRGLYFYFLPPHSPELNAIERLWKTLKYQKLPISCWEHISSLIDNLIHLFQQDGDAVIMPSLQQ